MSDGLLDAWLEVTEWSAEFTCSVTDDHDVIGELGDNAVGTSRTRWQVVASGRLSGPVASSWQGEGALSASWEEETNIDESGQGWIEKARTTVSGSGTGTGTIFLEMGIETTDPPSGRYSVSATGLTFEVKTTSWLFSQDPVSGIPSESSNVSTGQREVFFPHVDDEALPHSGLVLQGNKQIQLSSRTAIANVSWSLHPLSTAGSCKLTGISPAAVTLSIGEPREFTANGTGLAGVEWSAPGGTPAAGTGPTFTTQWAEAGEKTLTATCGGHAGDSTATVTVTTATQPPNDATPLTVDIRAEGVGMPLCRILAIGKSRKYRAVVAPAGGTIVWTCTGGASIVGSASAELVTVKGDTVSTTVDDVVLTLVYLRGLSSQSQEIKLTVADVTKIAVHVKASAAMTPGRGAALADHQFDCKETVEDFPPHKSLILLRGDFEDIELQATVNPTGTPLAWDVKRASDDAAALGHGLPTLTPNRADNTKANLKQNETGSFFVRAYGDCGDQKFDANAPFKLVPAVLVQATLQRDATEAHPRNLAEIDQTGTFVNVDSGIAQKIVRDSAGELIFDNPSLAAFHHKAYVHVVSGGEKGRLLIEHVYAGWVQDIVADVDWFGSYTAEGLSNAHSFTTVFATNDGTGPVGTVDIYGKKHRIFLPGEVPNLVATPLLDTLRLKNPGTGGVRATMLNSLPPLRRPPPKDGDLKDLGELWIVQSVDSPGTQFPLLHPVFTTAAHPVRLEGIHFELHFRANLCLWTNRSGAVGGVAENSYGVLHSFNWDMHAVWSIDAANKPPTVRSEMSIPISGRVTRNDALAKPKNAACEVYGPAGLALLRARAER